MPAQRWNIAGVPTIYAAGTRSLAALEYLAHIEPENAPDDLVFVSISIPDAGIETLVPRDAWSDDQSSAARAEGTKWLLLGSSDVLRVPSVIVPGESNFVIDPRHRDIARIRVDERMRAFRIDPRSLRRGREGSG